MEFYRVLEYSYHLCIYVNVSVVEISLDRARQNLIMQKPKVDTHILITYCAVLAVVVRRSANRVLYDLCEILPVEVSKYL